MAPRISPNPELLKALCQRWEVRQLSLFGSVLREDFSPSSDVDVLVTFEETARWNLLDLVRMRDELQALFGREVDLVEEPALRNPFRRHAILCNREVVYAA